VTALNVGETRWLHTNTEIFGIVRVGTHLHTGDGVLLSVDHSRHDLPTSVDPGEKVELTVEIPIPAPGTYRVLVDLIAEGVAWFEPLGSKPVQVAVTTSV
jgi:hypothetical protein